MEIIEDQYLRFHILSFLKKCNNCKTYQVIKGSDYCSVCKCFHCRDCTKYMRKFYGFFENAFCMECSLVFHYNN